METQAKAPARHWHVTSSPHIHAPRTTRGIMLDMLIALLPAGAAGVYFFGARAALVMLVSVVSAVAWEALIQRAMHRPITVTDLSAAVTGLLLAYNLPATVPLWLPVMGSFLAIVIAKQLFGGLGQNFVNPALFARAVLMASWAHWMSGSAFGLDAVSRATPLSAGPGAYSLLDLFVGSVPGSLGETSKAALLLGGVYLLARRVIEWRVPVLLIATVFCMSFLASGSVRTGAEEALYQTLSGGLFLGAFFMATDYATTPITPLGKWIMGIACGLLTFIIRKYNPGYPEGMSYAILIMNLATPLIDKYTRPRIFGEVRRNARHT